MIEGLWRGYETWEGKVDKVLGRKVRETGGAVHVREEQSVRRPPSRLPECATRTHAVRALAHTHCVGCVAPQVLDDWRPRYQQARNVQRERRRKLERVRLDTLPLPPGGAQRADGGALTDVTRHVRRK